jgi:hypothetical protein
MEARSQIGDLRSRQRTFTAQHSYCFRSGRIRCVFGFTPALRLESGTSGTADQPSAGDAGPYQYPSVISFGLVR